MLTSSDPAGQGCARAECTGAAPAVRLPPAGVTLVLLLKLLLLRVLSGPYNPDALIFCMKRKPWIVLPALLSNSLPQDEQDERQRRESPDQQPTAEGAARAAQNVSQPNARYCRQKYNPHHPATTRQHPGACPEARAPKPTIPRALRIHKQSIQQRHRQTLGPAGAAAPGPPGHPSWRMWPQGC